MSEPGHAAPGRAGPDDLHAELDRAATEVAAQVVAWRQHLHRHPELSNRESATAGLVEEHLRSLGLDEVRTGIAGHGVVGVLHGGASADRATPGAHGATTTPGNRVIALRADIDALPVKDLCGAPFASTVIDEEYPGGPFPVSHACGHDAHTAMLMGAATVLAGLRERLPGTVLFVFQPAEEGPPPQESGGAREMLRQGVFTDPVPTMAFGMHVAPLPKGYVGYREGNQFGASCLIRITVTGRQVHGSTPWEGIDPMPAAGALLTGIGQLYRQVPATDPVTVTIGHIEDVGRFNIIGETVTLWGTIRCSVESDMADLRQRLTLLGEHTAAAYGCTATVDFLQEVPAVHNRREWLDAGLPVLRRVVGADRLVQTPPTLGYDDVSEFVNAYGGLYVLLGVQDLEYTAEGTLRPVPGGRGVAFNHNPHFYVDDDSLATGVRLHAHIAYDHLTGALDGPQHD